LLQHRKPVIWLDIDTTVWKYPGLLFGEEDFAIYNWYADLNHHLEGMIEYNPDATNLFCSGGVQKWGYTAPAIELLIRWIRAIHESDKSKGDDPVLDYVFNKFQPPVKPLWLPKTYNRMDKHTWHWQSVPLDQVVINHDYTAGQHGLADC